MRERDVAKDMPVSFLPLLLPLVFIVLLIRGAIRGKRALLRATAIVIGITAIVALPFYVPGWWLMLRARRGDAQAMYELARWHENHCEKVGALILWPCSPDIEAGYRVLERSASASYPPAMYALGVRLKYGEFVPMPPDWSGPGGNVFPQPQKGQAWIDRALQAGYRPPGEEQTYYWHVFRR